MSSPLALPSISVRYRVSSPLPRQIRRRACGRGELELSRRIADAASGAKQAAMLSSAVFITCAVTGSGDSVRKNANVPVTPGQIAAAALAAHSAGAAIVHVHVRDPASGAPSRDPALFREVCERIRGRNDEVIINLTGGMGGDLLLGPDDAPLDYGRGTDFVGPRERIAHIVELLPEIASLDCGSLNFDEALYGTTPRYLRYVAQAVLLGGNVRVGLEDNLYLEKGVPATNAQLVERAVAIVELLGARVQSAAEARQRLTLAATRPPQSPGRVPAEL